MRIRRRLPSEAVERFRDRARKKAAAPIYALVEGWGTANVTGLRDAEPEIPDGLRDRAADVWEPLIAIADVIGGEWPARARSAALRLSGGAESNDDNAALTLLADIEMVFEDLPASDDVIMSNELVDHLKELDGRPWAEYGRQGKGLTTASLANLVKAFDVFPGPPKWVVVNGKRIQRRGYRRDAFRDAFARWLRSEVSQRNNPNIDGPESLLSGCNGLSSVTLAKT